MKRSDPAAWMWADAVQLLNEAERLHRQMFNPGRGRPAEPAWEPPVDVLETEREVLILAALPGVDPGQVSASIADGALLLEGRRTLPEALSTAVIHRMELPQGRFARRVPLPPGRYDRVESLAANGCVLITLHKA